MVSYAASRCMPACWAGRRLPAALGNIDDDLAALNPADRRRPRRAESG